jgi:ribosomal protein S1
MNKTKITSITEEINWDALQKYSKKNPNRGILEKHGARVYSHQPYAMDYFESVILERNFDNKEPAVGDSRKILDILSVNDKEMVVSLAGFVDAVIDIKGEKPFFSSVGLTPEDFVSWVKTETGRTTFLSQNYFVVIEQSKPFVRASITKGQLLRTRSEFFEQIKNPTIAYIGKILEKNGGGFIISVAGLNGFLPGSLAATNIVRDFDSMIGKETPVIVEDYLKDSDTFVFSYKKYVNLILPTKINDLSLDEKYQGVITGVAKYGIFVEFDEIFTGLLHTSKMSPECKEKFSKGGFRPGEVVSFWVKEIAPDKKIILTDEDPSVRRQEIEDFKEKNLGTVRGGEVISIQPFGTLVKLQKDFVGLISQKELKLKKRNFNVGDTVMVSVDRVHNDKIFLSLPNES